MNILCVTDIHGDRKTLEKILDRAASAQLTILGGDITNFGTPDEAEQLVRIVQQCGPPVVAVAGNCDSHEIDQRLSELGVSICGQSQTHTGFGIYGVSAMPPWKGTMYEFTEEAIRDALEAGRSQLASNIDQIVVSHAPPHGTSVDVTRSGAHVGSTAVRDFVERHQPRLVVSGHIHEAYGRDSIDMTPVVNCGPAFEGRYALIEIDESGIQIELRKA